MEKIIETLGAISKEELVKELSVNVMPNTSVLEVQEPYPGYHGRTPQENVPNMLFFVTTRPYSYNEIARVSCTLEKSCQEFDACPATVYLHNEVLHAIRIKDVENYESILGIQSGMREEGISFYKKMNYEGVATIKLDKIFYLEKLSDTVLKDLDEPMMHYLLLPQQLKWHVFAKVTASVKNNIDNNNFDAALGYIHLRDTYDFIRIYSKDAGCDRLEEIRDTYLKAITRLMDVD